MCGAPGDCGNGQGCVAGRCLLDGRTPAIQLARRQVIAPVDVAFLRRGDPPLAGALPPVVALGRADEGGALLLLRFNVPLAKDATIVEAYLLLERTASVDSDPTPITLHAARIVDPWDGRSISWSMQPRIEETRSPATTVDSSGRTLIRIDVRALVEHWRAHEKMDHGIAVLSDGTSPTGMAIALTVVGETPNAEVAEPPPGSPIVGGAATGGGAAHDPTQARVGPQRIGPRLELYLR